jgi:hypothetical protein
MTCLMAVVLYPEVGWRHFGDGQRPNQVVSAITKQLADNVRESGSGSWASGVSRVISENGSVGFNSEAHRISLVKRIPGNYRR